MGLLQFLAGKDTEHAVERPPGEPAKITVTIKNLSDVMRIAFPVAAIFQHCIERNAYGRSFRPFFCRNFLD